MRKILMFIMAILLIQRMLPCRAINNSVPESFKDYKVITIEYGGELFVSPNIKTEIQDVPDIPYVMTVLFDFQGRKYSVSYDTGPSGDPAFVFAIIDGKKSQEIRAIQGHRVYIGSNGYIYSEGPINNFFNVRRKFLLQGNKITEIKQPFLLVDLTCEINERTDIKMKPDEKSETAASLPKGSTVKVLLAEYYSQNYDIHMKLGESGGMWFLVSTPFGLVGWVKTKPGYMHFRPGKPLSCIRFMGD